MIHVCVACMLQKPGLFVLSAEQRKVFLKAISPDVNIAELEHLKLLVCINCLRQVKVVQMFQLKALRGAKNLIMLYKRMEQHNLVQNTIQVKEELDPLPPSTTIVPNYAAPIKDEPQNIIFGEAGTHDREIKQESLSEELVIKNEPEPDYSDSDTLSASEGETDIKESTMERVAKPLNTITGTQGDVHFEVLTHRKLYGNQSSKLSSDAVNGRPSLGANKRFECETCHKRFLTKKKLKGHHVNTQHPKEYNYKCNKCDKSYAIRGELQKHVAAFHGKQKARKPYVCDHCGAGFTIIKKLQAHFFKHSGARPYACPLCPATFKYIGALYKHNTLQHHKTKPKWPQSNRKRGNKKEENDAEGIDEDSREGDTGGTEMEYTEQTETKQRRKRKRKVK